MPNSQLMSRIVLFDKNYKSLIENLTGGEVIMYWPKKSNIDIFNFVKALILKIFNFKIKLKILYYFIELNKLSPKVVVSFNDTNENIIILSKIMKRTKFILIQDSYRPPGFYGSLKLKDDDIFLTYSPLVKFGLSRNEYAIKTFKYIGQKGYFDLKGSIIFISQFRSYSNKRLKEVTKDLFSKIPELQIDEDFDFIGLQESFLKYLNNYQLANSKQIFYKSAFRKNSKFMKHEEVNYFKRFNISKINISSIETISLKGNNIFLTIDSTMIFELLSHGQKVLIYPYRNIYLNQEMNKHLEILKTKLPCLFIEKNFSDFENKITFLKKLKRNEYEKIIFDFMNLPSLDLKFFA